MRHFGFLDDAERRRLFHRAPEPFGPGYGGELTATGLGATLYSPATRPRLADDIRREAARGVTSVVACLEDAVADAELSAAERNVVAQLRTLAAEPIEALPLVFVRVRAPGQVRMIVDALGPAAGVLTGFVLPKFTEGNGGEYLGEIVAAGERAGRRLLAMPVLESREIIHAETRVRALLGIRDLLTAHRDHVLAVRLGATDLAAVYGLRRPRELTVYDVRIVADVIAGIVNVLGREDGWVITGPVWEHYLHSERLFKPLLRETPFTEHDERKLRAELIARDLDGLIREISLDHANGLLGKTVIHPSHVAAVNAMSVVTHEEYADAVAVLETGAGGGVAASAYGNKMNESKPHQAWARRTALRARAFGVTHPDVSLVDLLAASLHQ